MFITALGADLLSSIKINALSNAAGALTNDGSGNFSWASAGGVSSYTANVGDGTNTTYTLTHNLAGSNNICVVVREVSSGYMVYPDIVYVDSNNCQLIFVSAPTSNQYKATVMGF